MLIAFLADIHANLEALDAVLAAVDEARPDQVYGLGDVVGYGADPAACIRTVQGRNIPCVAGNHDRAACGTLDITYFNDDAQRSVAWTRERLEPSDLAWLAELPLVRQTDLFSMSHGTLLRPENFDYVLTGADAMGCFEAHDRRVAFVAHSHVPVTFFLNGDQLLATADAQFAVPEGMRAIVTVGSVGQPRDGDPNAAFALFDTETLGVTVRRVRYDRERAMAKIRAYGLPETNALRLEYGM